MGVSALVGFGFVVAGVGVVVKMIAGGLGVVVEVGVLRLEVGLILGNIIIIVVIMFLLIIVILQLGIDDLEILVFNHVSIVDVLNQ